MYLNMIHETQTRILSTSSLAIFHLIATWLHVPQDKYITFYAGMFE